MYAGVVTYRKSSLPQLTIHLFGEKYAVLKMRTAHKVEENEGLGRIRVKSLIGSGVVVLKQHHGVLALAHVEIGRIKVSVGIG